MASACVAAFDGFTDLAWSQGERRLAFARFRLEWLTLVTLLAGARLRIVLIFEAFGERNHAAALCPGHACSLRLTQSLDVLG